MKTRWILLCSASLNLVACAGSEPQAAAVAHDDSNLSARAAPAFQKTPQNDGTVRYEANGEDVTVANEDPNLSEDLVDEILTVYFQVYRPMANRFNPSAPHSTQIIFDPGYNGVAVTSADTATVRFDSKYVASHPSDVDVITHETFHIVQSYDNYNEGGCPGWAIEGFADWARFRYGVKNVEAGWSLTPPTPSDRWTDSYRTTAGFFVWLEDRLDPQFPEHLDATLRANAYGNGFWRDHFGKTVDALWAEYAAGQ